MVEAAQDEVDVLVLTPTDELADARSWIRQERFDRRRVKLIPVKLDTPWVRDYGPFQVVDVQGRVSWVDAIYSGARPKDDRIPRILGQRLGVPVERVNVTLDGGGLISNGSGLCVMTRESLDDSGVSVEDNARVPEHAPQARLRGDGDRPRARKRGDRARATCSPSSSRRGGS